MPISHSVARFNRRVTNRVLGGLARFAPGFGVVEHVGRKSRRQYRTPVNVFRRPGGYTIALTYGPDADWVRNVLAAGSCRLKTRGRLHDLTRPRLFHDPQRSAMPAPVRLILGLVNVDDFLALDLASAPQHDTGGAGTGRSLRTRIMHAGNNVVRRFAGRRLYALLVHHGRRSGRTYSTPVVAWRGKGWILVPMPYGTSTDWYRNVLAADGCAIQIGGLWYAATRPRAISRADAGEYLAPVARIFARLLPIREYLQLLPGAASTTAPAAAV